MTKELDQIIDGLKEIIKLKNLKVSDEVLFSEACSFLRGQYASQNKNNFKPQIRNDFSSSNSKDSNRENLPPTEKQIKILNESKHKIPKTRGEATKIIKEYFEKQKKENI